MHANEPRARCRGETSTSFNGDEKRVRLRIVPCTIVSGRAPKAVLVNIGEGELGHSFGFKLERRTAEGWRWINRRQGFPLPLIYLRPDERSDPESLAVYFDEPRPIVLRPGLYRVAKSVDLAPGTPRPPTMSVTATFRVVSP